MLNFQQNVTKIIDLVYLFIKITGVKGRLSGSSLMELGSFFGFCNVFFASTGWIIYLTSLQASPPIKSQNSQFFFLKKKTLFSRKNLAGPVNLVKLAWKSRSQYVFEKKLFGFLYPTWTNFSEKNFQMIFSAVLSKNTVQCPKT